MTGTLASLAAAAVAFVGGHFLLSSRAVRAPLIARIGEGPFRGVYSLVAVAALAWLILAYGAAPRIEIWPQPGWGRPLVHAVMAVAVLLAVCGLSPRSPTAVGSADRPSAGDPGRGIFAVTRHPLMWGIALWAAAHMVVNGDAASLILFGGLGLLALAGMVHIDARRRAIGDEGWRRIEAGTSLVPFAALLAGRASWSAARIEWWRLAIAVVALAALILAHGPVIGPDLVS